MDRKAVVGLSSLSVALFLLMYVKKYSKKPCEPNPTEKDGKEKQRRKGGRNTVAAFGHPPIGYGSTDIWNTAMFFPDYFPENEGSKTRQLIWYLEQATSTIDVCIYGFAFKMLQDALMRLARQEGIAIRIVTNRHMAANRRFTAAGIQTRWKRHLWRNKVDPTQFVDLMHQKFVVIDGEVAMAGSLNWTVSSITENWENVMITTQPAIVGKLTNEFERMWEESDRRFVKPDRMEEREKYLEKSDPVKVKK